MEQNENKVKNREVYVILSVLCVAVVILAVAYAALSSTLEINFGTVSQNVQSWNVGFIPGTATATSKGTSTTGLVCGSATVTTDTVTVADSSISKPGDSCTYKLTVKNSGSINAKLSTITPVDPASTSCTKDGASMVCGNITYKLTTDDVGTTLLTANASLETAKSQTVYLSATYTGTGLQSEAVTQSGAGFTLVYNQA